MKKGVIFDLDQTLVDSSIAEAYRGKNWAKVNELIPQFVFYDGFKQVLDFIKLNDIKIAIVSTSVSNYVYRVLNHFSIPYNVVVAYHDVNHRKPNPEAMVKALTKLSLNADEVISFGDMSTDIQASNSANIASVACLWGTNEKEALLNVNPNFVINEPTEIMTLLV